MQQRNSLAAALLLTVSMAGCASSSGGVRVARQAELRQDYDRAVVEYSRALNANPNDTDARTGLERAKTRAAIIHYDRGRQLAAAGKLPDAVSEYQVAAEMNPAATEIREALQSAQNQLRAQVPVNRNGKTELESLIDRTRDLGAGGRIFPCGQRAPSQPRVPQRQQPGRHRGDRADGERQRDLRSGVQACVALLVRNARRPDLRTGHARDRRVHADLLPRDGARHDHRHP